MSEITREEALAHFGVKGMHWGVRKADPLTREARTDARASRKASKMTGAGSGKAKKAAKETVNKKKSDVPGYSDAYKAAQARHRKQMAVGRAALTTAAVIAILAAPVPLNTNGPNASAARGRAYMAGKPAMMNAPMSAGGVHKITTMR